MLGVGKAASIYFGNAISSGVLPTSNAITGTDDTGADIGITGTDDTGGTQYIEGNP